MMSTNLGKIINCRTQNTPILTTGIGNKNVKMNNNTHNIDKKINYNQYIFSYILYLTKILQMNQ